MRRSLGIFGMAAVATAALVGTAAAQEKKEGAPSPGVDFPLPKPGPEHEILKKEAGVWDATVESRMEPGGKVEVTKGVETNTLIGGGLWRISDFKGELMGMPFQGHSVTGYDASKKKYVGTWVDSMAPGLSTAEGTYDPKTRTLTTWIEGPCPAGVVMKFRMTTEYKDDDTRVATMHSPEGQGEEFAMMTIKYKRRPSTASAHATR
jgi:hypothetical protein